LSVQARAKLHKFEPIKYSVTPRELQLYAVSGPPSSLLFPLSVLAVGAEPVRDLQFLYEGHEDFAALPSFAVIPAQVVALPLFA
jgi:hypothetical protein